MPALTMKKLFSFVGKKKNQANKLDYSNQYDNLRHPPYAPNVYLNHHPAPPPPHTLAQRQQLYAQHQIIPSPLPAPASQQMPLQPHHTQQTGATATPQCLCQICSYQPGANFHQTTQMQMLPHQAAQLSPLSQQQTPQQQQPQQHCSQLIHQHAQHHQLHQQQHQHQQQLQQQLLQQFQSHQPQPQTQTHIQQPQPQNQHQQQSLNPHSNVNQTYASQASNLPALVPSAAQCVCPNCTVQQQQLQQQFYHQQQQQHQHQNQHQQQHQQHNNFQQQQYHQQQHDIVTQQQLVTQFSDSFQHQTNQPVVQQMVQQQTQQQQQQQQQQPQYHNHNHQVHQSQINGSSQPQPQLPPAVANGNPQSSNQALQYMHQTITNQIQPQQYHCHTIQSHQYEQQKQHFQQQQQQQNQHQRVQSLCLQSIQPSQIYEDYQQPVQAPRVENRFDLKGESQDSRYANSSVWQSTQSSQGINGYFEKTSNPKLEEHVYYNQQKHLPPYEPPPSYDTFMERKVKNSSLYTNGHQYLTCRSESLENKDSSYENLRRSRNSTYSNLANGRQELGHTS